MSEYSAYQIFSQIHGLRFLFNRQTGFIFKLIWSLWIFLAFVLCMIFLGNIFSRWNSLDIVSLTDKPEPIWEIPFPGNSKCYIYLLFILYRVSHI